MADEISNEVEESKPNPVENPEKTDDVVDKEIELETSNKAKPKTKSTKSVKKKRSQVTPRLKKTKKHGLVAVEVDSDLNEPEVTTTTERKMEVISLHPTSDQSLELESDLEQSLNSSRPKRNVSSISIPDFPVVKRRKSTSVEADGQSIDTSFIKTEREMQPEWEPGDIVWAHMSGYPWWPGLIEKDPLLHKYTRIKGKELLSRLYHIQFFGKAVVRGWVTAKSMMKFEGLEQFQMKKESLAASNPRRNSPSGKMMSWFEVRQSQMEAWKISVDEAEEALPYNKDDRRTKFGVLYIMDDSPTPLKNNVKRKYTKRKSSSSVTDKDSSLSSPMKSELDNTLRKSIKKENRLKKIIDQDISFESVKTLKPASKRKGNFVVYFKKNKSKFAEDNPSLSVLELKSLLKEQWKTMTEEEKAVYCFPFESEGSPQRRRNSPKKALSAVTNPALVSPRTSTPNVSSENSNGMVSTSKSVTSPKVMGKRVHKPSKRFLEADVNNMYHSLTRKPRKSYPKSAAPLNRMKPGKESTNKKNLEVETDNLEEFNKQITPFNHLKTSKNSELNVVAPVNVTSGDVASSTQISKVDEMPAEAEIPEAIAETCPTSTNNTSTASNGTRLTEHSRYKICATCEKTIDGSCDSYVKCDGVCFSFSHLSCVNLTSVPEGGYKCSECSTGNHICFACKQSTPEVKKCLYSQCGRFYHEDCLKKFPAARMETKGFVCPLHVCLSCIPDSPWNLHGGHKGRLIRCCRCPTAYHGTDSCLAAGSELITPSFMLCPRHFDRTQRHGFKQINVNWCFVCSQGGSLICCETCPAAFHAECLRIEPPEDSYFCRDCVNGLQPKFGDIVWVKLGCYRWWPAQICNPKTVPENIQAIKHHVGEFPVKFFGSNDYYWTNRSRVFLYQEGDKGTENASNRVLAKVYEKALQEAFETFQKQKALKASKEERSRNQKPPPYKHIKNNKPVGSVHTYLADPLEVVPCECNPQAPFPCGSDTECLNRMLMFECNPGICPAGVRCCNQRFQKREYAQSIPFKTDTKGWGLKTLVNIKKGQFVIEYVGELIDEEECLRRMKHMHEMNINDFYFLTIDKDRIIDAGPKGNLARYMNHSCQPNCETQKWTVNGDTRVGLFAVTDIPVETELTFNYNLDCLGNEKRPCCCKAPNCSGYIGERPKLNHALSLDKKLKESGGSKKKKRKLVMEKKYLASSVKKEHESVCFSCGQEGSLIFCKKQSCPKAYHLTCLKESVTDNWECPWHKCSMCDQQAILLCTQCPTSFCPCHHQDSIKVWPGGRILCNRHGLLQKVENNSEIKLKLKKPDNRQHRRNSDMKEKPTNGEASSSFTNHRPSRKRGRQQKSFETEDEAENSDEAAKPFLTIVPLVKGTASKQSVRAVKKTDENSIEEFPESKLFDEKVESMKVKIKKTSKGKKKIEKVRGKKKKDKIKKLTIKNDKKNRLLKKLKKLKNRKSRTLKIKIMPPSRKRGLKIQDTGLMRDCEASDESKVNSVVDATADAVTKDGENTVTVAVEEQTVESDVHNSPSDEIKVAENLEIVTTNEGVDEKQEIPVKNEEVDGNSQLEVSSPEKNVSPRRRGRPKRQINEISEEAETVSSDICSNLTCLDSDSVKAQDVPTENRDVELSEDNAQAVLNDLTVSTLPETPSTTPTKNNSGLRNIFETFSPCQTESEDVVVDKCEKDSVCVNLIEDGAMVTPKRRRKRTPSVKTGSESLRRTSRRTSLAFRESQNLEFVSCKTPRKRKGQAIRGRGRNSTLVNGNQTDSDSCEILKETDETTTAIITVETDVIDGLELKPFVQKYKLENGEFSLEEYEDAKDGVAEAET